MKNFFYFSIIFTIITIFLLYNDEYKNKIIISYKKINNIEKPKEIFILSKETISISKLIKIKGIGKKTALKLKKILDKKTKIYNQDILKIKRINKKTLKNFINFINKHNLKIYNNFCYNITKII